MTNAQIIFNESQRLAEAGKIGYTGRVFQMVLDDGTEITVPETETLHTYSVWQSLGYQVRKGEKAVAKITIWKHTAPKVEQLPMQDGENVEYIDKGKMFLKLSAFFSQSQVERIIKS